MHMKIILTFIRIWRGRYSSRIKPKWPDQKEAYWDVLLYSAQEIQARRSTRDTYYTYIYNGFYEALDQIMVSEELYFSNPDHVAQVDYVQIYNDHIIDETQALERIPKTVSDHGQVVALIRY